MTIVFFAHPEFLGIRSLNRFVCMLADGMKERGHKVEVWAPTGKIVAIPAPISCKKWLGYIDLFILFPYQVRKRIRSCSKETLFVITDNALGPWVPIIKNRPHVIHCHDFLAQRSALNEIPENITSLSGRHYQKFIRRGYSKGKNFISVSLKTSMDLNRFLPGIPLINEVIYNGLSHDFKPINPVKAREKLYDRTGLDLACGYILHIGGNLWYKNRVGVIEAYNAWRGISNVTLPLLLIGQKPDSILLKILSSSPYKKDIHFLCNVEEEWLPLTYAGAVVFLFPSLAEGFGWPIAEAMACGCPVITTNEAPMTEVAGNAGIYIPRRPGNEAKAVEWTFEVANAIDKIATCSQMEREQIINAGFENVKRFDSNIILEKIEAAYKKILQSAVSAFPSN